MGGSTRLVHSIVRRTAAPPLPYPLAVGETVLVHPPREPRHSTDWQPPRRLAHARFAPKPPFGARRWGPPLLLLAPFKEGLLRQMLSFYHVFAGLAGPAGRAGAIAPSTRQPPASSFHEKCGRGFASKPLCFRPGSRMKPLSTKVSENTSV